ncbi:TonB-dependent receptor plug domain-containing protein, partial [Undibacterium luofuense]|uniref:TonB-dependent receptor plug domain-containing protein n=1 Tax=Undibacterium luofuense TaxID=2828733 RepID=UPI0030EE32E0
MKSKTANRKRFVLTSISLAVLTLAAEVHAQETQRVEVTGSSIRRVAAEASLPVTMVTGEELEKRGMTTLADLMMALPESASLAPSNAGSGTNINLRGLGVNRTLVLLNGRRMANEAIADGYANLDVIPMSAIARVEILRDGASSIYGSDAIGGVVNFITKRSFEGKTISAQMVQPQKNGGADEQRFSSTVGFGNLENDGWNWYATVDGHRRSRLLGVHLNDGYAKRDDGLVAGSVHVIQTLELLYTLEKLGYRNAIYFDTFPDAVGLDPVAECAANISAVEGMCRVLDRLRGNA